MTTSNTMQIGIEVIKTGTDAAAQVSTELENLSAKATGTATGAKAASASTDLMNTSINKMVPGLQMLNPLMGAAGLSGIMALALPAAAIAAVVGLVALAETLDSLESSLVSFGAISNQYTLGPMMDFNQTMRLTSSLALQLGLPLGTVANAMSELDQTTRSNNVSQSILAKAMQISKDTGLSLKTVLADLEKAYNGEYVNGQWMMGDEAINQVTKDLESQSSTWGKVKGSMNAYASQGLETLKMLGGAVGEFFLLAGQMLLAFFSPTEWQRAWEQLKGWWNAGINALEPLWKNFLPSMKADWDSFVKVTEWLTKMGQDAYNWLIGDGLNWFKNGINTIIDWIGNVFSNLWNSLTSTFSNLFGGQSSSKTTTKVPGQANGGITTSPGLSVVGERGPELLSLPTGATVMPLGAGGGMGGNIYVTVNVQGSVMTEQELSTAVSNNILQVVRNRGGY